MRSVTRAHRSSTASSARPREPPATRGRTTRMRAAGKREPVGQDSAHAEGGLGRGAHHEASVLVEPGHGERGLERDGGSEGQRHSPSTTCCAPASAPSTSSGADRHPRGDGGLVAGRGLGVEHRGERLEIDLGEVHRAPRELGLLGGGHRQAVADVPLDGARGGPPRPPRTAPARRRGGRPRPTCPRGRPARGRGATAAGRGAACPGAARPRRRRPVRSRDAGSPLVLRRRERRRARPPWAGRTRCSGTARRARRGPRPRSGSAPRRAGPAPPARVPACRSRTGRPPSPRTPPAAGAGARPSPAPRRSGRSVPGRARRGSGRRPPGRPSSRTAQAPQRPVAQPALTPKMPAPRSRSRRVVRASASARSTRPFTLSSSRPEVK